MNARLNLAILSLVCSFSLGATAEEKAKKAAPAKAPPALGSVREKNFSKSLVFEAKGFTSDASHATWSDNSNAVTLEATGPVLPKLVKSANGKYSSVSFSGKDRLSVNSMLGKFLVKKSEITVIFVAKSPNFQSPSEFLGYGDCVGEKVEVHFPYKSSADMVTKEPGNGVGGPVAASFQGKTMIVAMTRNEKGGKVYTNTSLAGEAKNLKPFKVANTGTMNIGEGSCANPYVGEIARIEITPAYTEEAKLKTQIEKLMKEYDIN